MTTPIRPMWPPREKRVEGRRVRVCFPTRTYLIPLRVIINHKAAQPQAGATFRHKQQLAATEFDRDPGAAVAYLREKMSWADVARHAELVTGPEPAWDAEWAEAPMALVNAEGKELKL